uniref:EAL domain-containing protein n=1 Tax=candidate division WOR-3 bacterium TaxID=2052148 RepID=A0A7C4YC50_UNCW3
MDKEIARLKADLLRFKSALYDANTLLPTLNIEFEKLKSIVTRNKKVCCVYITIGRENMLEQIYGWETYDEVIKLFVKILKDCLSKTFKTMPVISIPSIKSDDIFIFFSEENTNEEISDDFVEKVIFEINNCLKNIDAEKFSDIWKKITFFSGYEIFTFEPMARIERTIYQATEKARFSAYFKEKKSEEELLNSLKEIIKRKAISTYFQPIYDINNNYIFGFEALSRGPKNSFFFEPDIIFSIASRTDLINDVESLCLTKAIENSKKIEKGKHIFLNVTPNFIPNILKEEFLNILNTEDNKRIVFEITEKFVIYENKVYGEFIDKLKNLNFNIALDDVGTGYSTLERIAEIKPKYLKYDRILIRGISKDLIRQELIKSMLEFSKKIDSIIIAEGIENEEDLSFLKEIGINYAQGFLLGRPEEI